jgi:DNA-binding transcriptional ArsR family regulator
MAKKPPQKREITSAVPEPTALKALAHPDRLRMLGLLRFDGPATATGLARRLGLNSGATSYHLRQLAEHGFIEPAEELGNRRERWWRVRHETTTYDPAELRGESLEAGMAMAQAVLSQQSAFMQKALEQFPDQPQEWKQASNASDYTMAMTADEAMALKEKLSAILWEAVRQHPAQRGALPEGKRNYMVLLHAFPFPGIVDTDADDRD